MRCRQRRRRPPLVWIIGCALGSLFAGLQFLESPMLSYKATKATSRAVSASRVVSSLEGCDSIETKAKTIERTRVAHLPFMQRPVILQHDNLGWDLGNWQSHYWAGRALAELGGYHYWRFWVQGVESHLKHLPNFVPCNSNNRHNDSTLRLQHLQRLLCNCNDPLHDLHECQYGHTGIIDTIRRDTRQALVDYGHSRYHRPHQSPEKQQLLGEFYGPHDWLIYDRCQMLDHRFHGFATLHPLMDALPQNTAYTVYTILGRREGLGRMLCDVVHEMRKNYIHQHNPNVTMVDLDQSKDSSIDFGRMVFAPNLLIPSAGSSWALWAGIANAGRVVTVPFQRDFLNTSLVPSNFEVHVNATVLYNPLHHVPSGKLLGFDDPQDIMTLKGKQKFIDCYRNC